LQSILTKKAGDAFFKWADKEKFHKSLTLGIFKVIATEISVSLTCMDGNESVCITWEEYDDIGKLRLEGA